jgi:hypothetical protein
MTRRGILTIVVAVCAVSGADRALARDALPPCAAPQTEARVDGRSPQPTEQEARQAEIACGLGGPDLRDNKAAKDVDELYKRLMRESVEDLKERPNTESLTSSAVVGQGGVPSQ